MKTFLMVTYRYFLFFFYIARILFYALLFFRNKSYEERFSLLRSWARTFLKKIHLHLEAEGNCDIKNTGSLFVANHITYFDPIVLILFNDFRFIAGSELKKWPVIGPLTEHFDLIYIDRDKSETSKKVAQVTDMLNHKKNVVLFPEGTTSTDNSIRPFKNSYFQAAFDADTTVSPVVIRYLKHDGAADPAFNFTNDRGFFRILTDVFKSRDNIIKVVFLEPRDCKSAQDRFELAEKTREDMLEVFQRWP